VRTVKDQKRILDAAHRVGATVETHEGSDNVRVHFPRRVCMCTGDGKRLTARQFAEVVAGQYRKIFDRSFVTTVSEKDGKITITAEERDSGQDNMTVADLAALLQTDRRTIRRLTETRAQRSDRHPIPFFKINGKMIRFNRAKIEQWLSAQANDRPALAPVKGKRQRGG
jgi:excisionase family DNA binding protein